jgi:DNA-binding MarR family transcriptional regulator
MSDRLRSQIGRDLLVDSGLSEADYRVLVSLSEAEGRRIRVTELAERLDWSKSRLSHQLARMEARRLVERQGCASDNRGSFAVLSRHGWAEIRRAAPKHVASVRRHLIDLLDGAQLEELEVICNVVLTHLRVQPGAPESACGEGAKVDGEVAGEPASR